MQTNTRQAKMTARRFKLSAVVPVHNEAENIVAFIRELSQKLQSISDHYEIILVDDGSQDETVALIEGLFPHPHLKLLVFSRNFGKENALTAGLAEASGDATLLIDADFQHPLSVVDRFIEKWLEGYDMVYGVRETRADESWLKRNFSRLFYWFMKNMGEISVPPDAGDFRLLDRRVVLAINHCPERSRFMKGLYAWVGFKSYQVPYAPNERAAGESSWRFMHLAELALTGILSFSDMPLRVWSLIGLIVSLFSFVAAIYIILDTLVMGVDVPGYATLLTAIIFFGGIQMLSIGILGEYVARIFREVKKRPQYIVAEKRGFDDKA